MNITFCFSIWFLTTTLIFSEEQDINGSLISNDTLFPSLNEWESSPRSLEMKLFLIPPTLCLLASLLVTPLILFTIFSNFYIRQETRYLLLGNAMLCDLLYLLFYTLSTSFNVADFRLPREGCVILMFLLALTYCGGLLSSVGMVLDTYLAILWPLQYTALMTSSRTKKLILFLWVASGLFHAMLFFILWVTQEGTLCPVEICSVPVILVMILHGDHAVKLCYALSVLSFLLCLLFITFCYFSLYFKTRQSDIWHSAFSRARVTFLLHHTLLFLYFCPFCILLVEILLYLNDIIGMRTGILVSLTVCDIFLVLPKALSPYFYGLRYRDITQSLQLLFSLKRLNLGALDIP
ncbi:probable G-protein coupled receptor 148 [Ornithorhynchus anatinus]|uniref:probable G-protein coupled receptor 148 n=1 Tax=Ornithorhynchus anatinus TaxID=9258 RepID=UPI0001554736|nr:probable G-protein coupled receptor 148 [Ornithorhynchus anatinus]